MKQMTKIRKTSQKDMASGSFNMFLFHVSMPFPIGSQFRAAPQVIAVIAVIAVMELAWTWSGAAAWTL